MGWKEKAEAAQARLRGIGRKARDAALAVRTDVETIGAGAAAGAIRGHAERERWTYDVMGVAPELVVAVPLKLLGYSGMAKEAGPDMHAVGNGILSYYVGMRAQEWARTRPASTGRAPRSFPRPTIDQARREAARQPVAA